MPPALSCALTPIAPLALGLVLLAACFHAGWNLLLHETSDRVAAMAVAGLVAGAGLLPFTLAAPPWRVWPLVLLSGVAEAAYALFLTAAYQRGALAVAYPIGRGTAPVLVTLGAWLVLAQRPGALTLLGAALLLAGLSLVALAGHRAGQLAAAGFAVLTGCAIAAYSVIDARAVGTVGVAPLAYLGPVLAVDGALLLLWMRVWRGWKGAGWARVRAAARPGLRIAIGSVAAYALVLFAFQRAGAGRIATLRELSVLLGVFFSRGRRGWQVWLGASLVVAGMVLTAL
ncbi:MAG TPA: EamA family transporter [Ktedonobacterales bacterium]